MPKILLAPPLALPVSVAQAKEFLKIETNDDDQLIADLIKQATSHISALCGRKLITQTWRLFFDDLPTNKLLELNIAPISALVEVRYFDKAGDPQIISPQGYEFDPYSFPARLKVTSSICTGPDLNGIEVDVHVGYGITAIDVPGNIIRAIFITIAHWYEFRGAVHPSDQPLSNPAGLNRLIAPYKSRGL